MTGIPLTIRTTAMHIANGIFYHSGLITHPQ